MREKALVWGAREEKDDADVFDILWDELSTLVFSHLSDDGLSQKEFYRMVDLIGSEHQGNDWLAKHDLCISNKQIVNLVVPF